MAHRLNTNKQFMVGNGILAFAVIFVVVIFVYMSMRLQQQKAEKPQLHRNLYHHTDERLCRRLHLHLHQRQPAGEPHHDGRTFHPRGETLCRTKRTDDCEQCNREAFPV